MTKQRIFLLSICCILLFVVIGIWITQNNPTTIQKPQSIKNTSQHTTSALSSNRNTTIPFKLPELFTVHTFATNVGVPRDMVFSPGETLLVSDPINNQIIALPDPNNVGIAQNKHTVLDNLNQPHGLAFYKGKLYVSEVDKVVRYLWDEKNLSATKEKVLFSLPNTKGHTYRSMIFDQNGDLYVSVGSTCNVCTENSPLSATVLISDSEGNNPRVFAKGLRNAPFLAINPNSGKVWVSEMGRDHLGDTTPPDEINILEKGKNYGWPLCYGNKIHDTQFDKNIYKKNPCEETVAPIYEIPAHSAPLGITFINSSQFPSDWQNDLLVAYHGSWNRSEPDGYKIVHMNVEGNKILSSEDFMTGFLPENAHTGRDATNRPVDLIFDKKGNLYVSDDKGGNIFLIQKS